jgi:hypothetical protein
MMADKDPFDYWFKHYPIAYMDSETRVHWLGNYEVDDEGIFWEQAVEDAQIHAKKKGERVVRMIEGDDLTELSSEIQYCFNVGNQARGNSWRMVGTLVDEDELPLVYELAKKYPKSEFLVGIADECKRAFNKKGKKNG